MALIDYDNDGWLDALTLSGTRLKDGTREEVVVFIRPSADQPAVSKSTRRHLRGRDGRGGPAPDRLGVECVRRGLRQRRLDGSVRHRITAGTSSIETADGRFEDVTTRAGLAQRDVRWGSGCSFVDIDRDGRLDLFVANYLRFDLATAPEPGSASNCLWKGIPVNCGPKGLPTDTNLLYRNRRQTARSRMCRASRELRRVTGRYPMTALAADFDADGWPDIYVACDSTAAILYRNNRDGTFTDVAVESGIAYSENGIPRRAWAWPSATSIGDGRLDRAQDAFRRRHSVAV